MKRTIIVISILVAMLLVSCNNAKQLNEISKTNDKQEEQNNSLEQNTKGEPSPGEKEGIAVDQNFSSQLQNTVDKLNHSISLEYNQAYIFNVGNKRYIMYGRTPINSIEEVKNKYPDISINKKLGSYEFKSFYAGSIYNNEREYSEDIYRSYSEDDLNKKVTVDTSINNIGTFTLTYKDNESSMIITVSNADKFGKTNYINMDIDPLNKKQFYAFKDSESQYYDGFYKYYSFYNCNVNVHLLNGNNKMTLIKMKKLANKLKVDEEIQNLFKKGNFFSENMDEVKKV